jgi:threonine-phosphate decarboxylase
MNSASPASEASSAPTTAGGGAGFTVHEHGGALEAICREHGVDPAGVLDFSINVNPLGPPPEMVAAMHAALARVDRYPEPDQARLRAALADHAGADPGWVLPGNGSSDLLYLLMNALRPGSVAVRIPAYSDYERAARAAEAEVEYFTVDLRRALRHSDLVILGSPANPTGRLTELTQLIDDVRARPECRVVVDHAFFEFVRPLRELAPLPVDWPPNLLSLRSLTKFYGLAGVRLGYLDGRPEVIDALAARRPPWSVNVAAEAAAGALGAVGDYPERTRALIGIERERVARALGAGSDGVEAAGFRRGATAAGRPFVYPSTANFLLLKLPEGGPDSIELRRRCLLRGVLIRDGSNFAGLDRRHVRVAIRTAAENDRMIAAVRASLEA